MNHRLMFREQEQENNQYYYEISKDYDKQLRYFYDNYLDNESKRQDTISKTQ